jgi:hypothetical protein
VKDLKLRSKYLYKITLLIIKVLPSIIGLCAFFGALFDYHNINSCIFNYIVTGCFILFLYISSYVFRFCSYHRLPLHYFLIVNILNIIDTYIGIPIDNFRLFQMYLIISGLFIVIYIYQYVTSNKRRTNKDNK